MIADLKFAFRQMAKHPGFALTAILILALGIGSNTAVFTAIDAVLLRGLPVRHPEELVLVAADGSAATRNNPIDQFSYPAFQQFGQRSKSLSEIAGLYTSGHSLVATGFGQTNTIRIQVSGVSGNYFTFLGVPPALGRTLAPADDKPNAPRPVVVLSHSFWERQFGSDPGVLGKTVSIENTQVSIVGVAAAGFRGVEIAGDVDLWMPLQLYPVIDPTVRPQFVGSMASKAFWLRIMGRVKPGFSRKAVSSELEVIFKGVLSDAGLSAKMLKGYGMGAMDVEQGGSGYLNGRLQVVSLLGILMAVVGAVLIIACANVASLILARTSGRTREFALRSALGAGRAQLIRQLLVESFLLAAAGGITGLLVSNWAKGILAGFLPGGKRLDLSPDHRVLLFTAAISAGTGVLVGLLPALRFSRLDLVSAIKAQASTLAGGSGQRLNKCLVAAQIALSVCLLAGAGLFVRTIENLKDVDAGFNHHNVLTVYAAFGKSENLTRKTVESQEILAKLQALPGVAGATFSWGGGGLMSGSSSFRGTYFSVAGYVPRAGETPTNLFVDYVGPQFFQTMGIPILQGREITAADDFPPAVHGIPAAQNVIVINQSFARRYFADGDSLGRQIRIPNDELAAVLGIKQTSYRVIGVVKDTKEQSLRDEDTLQAYFPVGTMPAPPQGIFVQVRTVEDPLTLVTVARGAIQAVNPQMTEPLFGTMDSAIDRSMSQERIVANTAGWFSLFALLLASLGLYGVLAYNVTQRTREIGVRMALGAGRGSILSLVLGQGLALAAIGCAAGTAAAMALEHLIASRLYGLHAFDPITFLLTSAVLLVVALLACWLPARRATKVDPMIALRAE